MCYSMMPYCICYNLRLCYIGHCVNLCGTQTGHLTVIPFALLFHHLCTASHIYLAGSNLQNLTSQIAEPHKPNCRTSQAKLQNLTSQIAEPQKPNCGTSQANLQNLTSQIAELHKPDCRTPQANLQNLTSQSDSDRQLVTLEYQHRHDSHAEGILASASTILRTTLSNIW